MGGGVDQQASAQGLKSDQLRHDLITVIDSDLVVALQYCSNCTMLRLHYLRNNYLDVSLFSNGSNIASIFE